METPQLVVIDGPAGAGKSSVARRLAVALSYTLLDTGALYRAVALLASQRGISWEAEDQLAELARSLEVRFDFDGEANRTWVGGKDVSELIRAPEIAQGASRVSAFPAVRAGLLELQRRIGRAGRVVAEGRDMGSVVFPQADAKFFLTASPRIRAGRRVAELAAAGRVVDLDETIVEITERDRRDSERAVAPLVRAEGARVIDSSDLSLDQVVDAMLAQLGVSAGAG